MRLRSFVFALVVAGSAVSIATAAQPAGQGTPPSTGPGCRPRITVVLQGSLASTPGASATSISVNVAHSNHHGLAFAKTVQPLTILVDGNTMVRRQGKKTLGDLLSGDRVLVQARACKADLANNATPQLTATRIIAHPANTHGNGNGNSNGNGNDDKD
jgi:hypothetical protein